MLSRRQFIKVGLVSGAALLAVRAAYGPLSSDPVISADPGFRYAVLGAKERTTLAAIVPVMLAGALPEDLAGRERAVVEVMRGIDVAISGLPPTVQQEVGQLFALLGFPLTRRIVAGVVPPWLEASPETVAAFLDRWRRSPLALLRTAYRALQELIMAAWYGNPAAWPRIGYSGPPALNR